MTGGQAEVHMLAWRSVALKARSQPPRCDIDAAIAATMSHRVGWADQAEGATASLRLLVVRTSTLRRRVRRRRRDQVGAGGGQAGLQSGGRGQAGGWLAGISSSWVRSSAMAWW